MRNYLKPALGHIPLQGMTQLHVERYYADLTDVKKLAPSSLLAHAAVLSSALKAAVKARKIRENVAQLAKNRPRRSQANGDVLNKRVDGRGGAAVSHDAEIGRRHATHSVVRACV